MHLSKTRVFRISGRIVDAATGATSHDQVMVMVSPKEPGPLALGGWSGNTRPGTFDFAYYAPGVYIVHAASLPVRGAAGIVASTIAAGQTTVTITNADLDNVLIRLSPGLEIVGHVSASAPRMTVRLRPLDGVSSAGMAELQPGGAFVMHHVEPVIYRVEVANLPAGMYLKSARFGERDVTRAPLDLSSGATGRLDIVLAPNAPDIAGIVHDPTGAAMPAIAVTLWNPRIPSDPLAAADFAQTATTDALGQFKFTNLPPGEYRVAAWEQIDQGLGIVPEFRTQFDARATTVTLKENDHAKIEPALIPRRDIEAEASKLR
jgi:hypothetical protein